MIYADVLQVNEIQMASAFLSWTPPSIMNGPLLKYQLVSHSFENDSLKVVEWEGNQTQAVLTSLAPYQRYCLVPVSLTPYQRYCLVPVSLTPYQRYCLVPVSLTPRQRYHVLCLSH